MLATPFLGRLLLLVLAMTCWAAEARCAPALGQVSSLAQRSSIGLFASVVYAPSLLCPVEPAGAWLFGGVALSSFAVDGEAGAGLSVRSITYTSVAATPEPSSLLMGSRTAATQADGLIRGSNAPAIPVPS